MTHKIRKRIEEEGALDYAVYGPAGMLRHANWRHLVSHDRAADLVEIIAADIDYLESEIERLEKLNE